MKLKNDYPFQCYLNNDSASVLVNFGTVVCFKQSLDNIFIPTINDVQLKRFDDEGYVITNSLPITSLNNVICLRIKVENIDDLVNSYTEEWEHLVISKDQDSFLNSFLYGMSRELQQEHFNIEGDVFDYDLDDDSNLDIAAYSNFNSMVNWAPAIRSVSIVEFPIEDFDTFEDNPSFNFIQYDEEGDFYYKDVPICLILEGQIIQLINFDYCFTFPFYWLETLKEEF